MDGYAAAAAIVRRDGVDGTEGMLAIVVRVGIGAGFFGVEGAAAAEAGAGVDLDAGALAEPAG